MTIEPLDKFLELERIREDVETWDALASQYKDVHAEITELKNKLESLEAKKEKIKEQLVSRVDGDCMIGSGIKVSKQVRKGLVNYKEFLKYRGIDVKEAEKFRGEEKVIWTVSPIF